MKSAQELRKAILKRDYDTIRRLAEYAHFPTEPTYKTPFQLAVELGYADVVELLAELVDVNWFDWRNKEAARMFREMRVELPLETPLHTAVKRCDKRMVEILLRHGADPNVLDEKGYAPIHYAERCDVQLVQMLLEHGAVHDQHIVSDNLEIIELLLKHGAKLPIDLHVLCKRPELLNHARYISEYEAVILADCAYHYIKHRVKTPKLLPYAVRHDDVETVKELLPHADVRALAAALREGPSRRMAALLVKRILELTPDEAKEMASMLDGRIDCDCPPHEALLQALLYYAAETDKIGLLKHLLTFATPPHDIICHATNKTAKILADRGAPLKIDCALLFKPGIFKHYVDADNLICAAVSRGEWKVVRDILSDIPSKCAKQLLCNAVVDAPEEIAIDIIKTALKSGISPNFDCGKGKTLLHVAAEFCRTKLVKLLLDHGADPLINPDITPVEVACNAARDLILSYLPSFS
ncbi:MAG: ankyrin repeat domain-containing protein [Pyrobaculum sp.]